MSLSFSRLQGKEEEAGLSLSCLPATLPHTALAELCLNFTFSRVQQNHEKLQYEVRGSAGRGGWERAGNTKSEPSHASFMGLWFLTHFP